MVRALTMPSACSSSSQRYRTKLKSDNVRSFIAAASLSDRCSRELCVECTDPPLEPLGTNGDAVTLPVADPVALPLLEPPALPGVASCWAEDVGLLAMDGWRTYARKPTRAAWLAGLGLAGAVVVVVVSTRF